MEQVDLTNKIANHILVARKNLKMTQKQVAEALGISEGQFSHYEKGRAKPDINIIYQMCVLFGASFDEWLGLSSNEKIYTPDSTIKKYHRLNDDGKKKAGEYISDLEQMPKYQLQTDDRKLKEVGETIGTIIRTVKEMETAEIEVGIGVKK